ncbi:terpenoid cyclases/protein prenyltransferase alpha-alpha toroid [Kockovaella imperatae]|uniref:Terpenoid cyclases/protein prenyltransferase alpha-alpha toroid n=1 Tax=Kockovaella imperatae TaxID=4999 RepID=A0A1Y1UAA5_9TREE|nr:terpenoid cyclases/protein prenyltransferase alpha-alpha toroid [Kockovaella imperatae]ORX34942.1 terpenoid cyclases/protein prenyltransferase alpha-alpha toroid [Kockovaella imperatae]
MSSDGPVRQTTFKRNGHVNFFLRCLQALPASGTSQDANRITIAYFCLSGLELLGALEDKTTAQQRDAWIEWIWSLRSPNGGFGGSTFMITTSNANTSPGHLPSTYTALLCLAILRAPLDRLDVPGLVSFLRSCQGQDGSFSPLPRSQSEGDFQSDLRMTYCACAVSSIISDFSGINVDAARAMIRQCRTWEGGYAARPGIIEAQGGTTYCAMASLKLLEADGKADSTEDHEETLRWLLQRQIGGFQGRPGKLEDVCYSFWCGGALSILGRSDLLDAQSDRTFLLSAQYPFGGFGKEPEDPPDPYHSYLALAALSMHEPAAKEHALGLKSLVPTWNVSEESAKWLRGEISRIKALKYPA